MLQPDMLEIFERIIAFYPFQIPVCGGKLTSATATNHITTALCLLVQTVFLESPPDLRASPPTGPTSTTMVVEVCLSYCSLIVIPTSRASELWQLKLQYGMV